MKWDWDRAIFTLSGIEAEYSCRNRIISGGNELNILIYKDKKKWVVRLADDLGKEPVFYKYKFKFLAKRKANSLMYHLPEHCWKEGLAYRNLLCRMCKWAEHYTIKNMIMKEARIRDS